MGEGPCEEDGEFPATPGRERRRERKARYRQAQREGKITVPVTLDAVGIEWLIRGAGCLAEADAGDRGEIGAAISRMIAVSCANNRGRVPIKM